MGRFTKWGGTHDLKALSEVLLTIYAGREFHAGTMLIKKVGFV